MNPYYDPNKPHHRPDGFRNNHSEGVTRSLADVMRWRLDAARQGVPKSPQAPIPTAAPDLARLQAYAQHWQHHRATGTAPAAAVAPTVTWIGHATALVQMGGLTLLTDPIFSLRASPLRGIGPKRHQPPGLALHELPHIDLVLASHNHYDHLDEASVKALNAQAGGPPLFVVPLGLKPWLAARGIRHAIELDWWDHHRLPHGAGEVVLVPAQHWSARGLNDRMLTLWGGFAVFSDDCHLFYGGDTGYSRDFTHMRQRFAERQTPQQGGGFDLALLPIGAYEPRWFMAEQHVNVEEAVQIHLDLGAKRSLGLHWGTFALTDEALDAPPIELHRQRLARGLAEHDFFVMAIGQTRELPPRGSNGR